MSDTAVMSKDEFRKLLEDKSTVEVVIDNYELIKEVKKYPILYDRSVKHTSETSAIRKKAWHAVGAKVCRKYWEKWNPKKKDKAVICLQKRWKNLRNCFHREVRAQKNSKHATYRRKYRYFNVLQFLATPNQLSDIKDNDYTNDDNDIDHGEEEDEESGKSNKDSDGEDKETFIDTEDLIREVARRPLLYDKTLKIGPTTLSERKECWHEICACLLADWDAWDADQKEEAVKEVQKRWLNLRSSFTRQLRSQKKNPSAKIKKYMNYDSMQFLVGHCGERRISTEEAQKSGSEGFSFKQEQLDDYGDDDDQDPIYYEIDMEVEPEEPTSSTQKPRKKGRTSIEEVIIEDPLQLMKMKGENLNVDQDMNFALSIVPMLRALPLSTKLQTQIEILKLFQKATK